MTRPQMLDRFLPVVAGKAEEEGARYVQEGRPRWTGVRPSPQRSGGRRGSYYCRFRRGDRVEICESWPDGSLGSAEVKDVEYLEDGRIRVFVSRKRKNPPQLGIDYFLFPQTVTYVDQKLLWALEENGSAPHAMADPLTSLPCCSHRSRGSGGGHLSRLPFRSG